MSFAPSRRGRGRRVSRSQVKVQTRRITGPVPRPRRCKRLRVGDMRRTFSNPALKNSLGAAAWERLPYNRTPSGEGQPKILLRRAIGFQAPALAASQQTTVNGQTFLRKGGSAVCPCLWDALRKVEGIEWAARLASLLLNQRTTFYSFKICCSSSRRSATAC